MLKKILFCFSLIILSVALAVSMFFSAGTFRLWRGGFYAMDREGIRDAIWQIEYSATLYAQLEEELGCNLKEYFDAQNDAQMAVRHEFLSEKIAEHVVKLCVEEGNEKTEEFADKYNVRFSVYHYHGRHIGGNLEASLEKIADRHLAGYNGMEYPVYVMFDGWALQKLLTNEYGIDVFWLRHRFGVAAAAAVAIFMTIIFWGITGSFVRRRGEDETGLPDRIPLGLFMAAGALGLYYLYREMAKSAVTGWKDYWVLGTFLAGFVFLEVFLVWFLIWRMKKDGWYRFTLFHLIWRLAKTWSVELAGIFAAMSLTWKWLFAELLITLAELGLAAVILTWDQRLPWFLGALGALKLLLLPWIVKRGMAIGKLRVAIGELAGGKLDVRLEEEEFPKSLRGMARDLNASAGGVATAVEERLKSERLKTELITNVSHDIKTPLTSIINFSDLIMKEDVDNPKVKEYSEHLHAQSARLKKLIEDLIEASKASSGNLEAHLAPCDARVLLGQCLGEYESHLKEKDLELILKQSDEPLRIMADPRMLWRVFDNLMNNVCKYAQKDTRVYLSAERVQDRVRIIFKNVSKYALDISPEDLMERFVRGDLSRHTEGNGLGLSIVSSLMELQGGKISIDVDADLFKVTLEFSVAANDGDSLG